MCSNVFISSYIYIYLLQYPMIRRNEFLVTNVRMIILTKWNVEFSTSIDPIKTIKTSLIKKYKTSCPLFFC